MKLSLFWSTLALILATRRSCCEICSGFPAILIRAVKCNLCPTLRGGWGSWLRHFPAVQGLDLSGGPRAEGVNTSAVTWHWRQAPFHHRATFRNEHVRMPPERSRSAKPQRPSGLDRSFALIRISMHHYPVTRVPWAASNLFHYSNTKDKAGYIKQFKYYKKY